MAVQASSEDGVDYGYGLDQAIGDGALVEVFKRRWAQLTGGKPLVATSVVAEEISQAGLFEIWNAYVGWRRMVEPGLPETERQFGYSMNGRMVWVIEDGQAFTILYPEDY